jgi:TPR repeat protein
MKNGRQILLCALLLMGFASAAQAERRVALVVGNSAYQNVTPLENPSNDASFMADTLKDLGFTLVGDGPQLNLEKTALDTVVQSFGRQLQGADVALFYYAGHGVQIRGSNYLVPVNANPTREADVDFQMVDVNLVLNQMEGSGTRLNLVILDACRNNPFGARGLRSADGGLAQMHAPDGTLISYATQPGSVAQDGNDGHSPYTKALAATIRRSGLDIFQTFNEIGLAVKRSTGGSQRPWVSSSPIDGSFYFANPALSTAPLPSIPPQQDARLTNPIDPAPRDIVTDCDRLAANPLDPQRPREVNGVRANQIDIVPALQACSTAMRQFPDVPRFAYQAGRVAYVQKDYGASIEFLKKAASRDYTASFINIGNAYSNGYGVPIDFAEARKWYEKALAAGDLIAMNNIGYLYQEGRGVPRDYAQAIRRYEKAAAEGLPLAMVSLGNLYREGKGVSKDTATARRWYEKAAAEGNPEAMTNLGYLAESSGDVPHYDEARRWYEKAADAGQANAMANLGNLYRAGHGVPKSYSEARRWYEKSAAAGNDSADKLIKQLDSGRRN